MLSPFVDYTCKIVAKNRVSEVAARKHKVEARSTTIKQTDPVSDCDV